MTQTFGCPSCGAALDIEDGDVSVVRCAYCDSAVVVPEYLRSQDETPPVEVEWQAAPLTIDLRGLTGKVAVLRAIKEHIRVGDQAEATRLYQETFGASDEEAESVVNSLASGQSVVISAETFSTSLPLATSRQARVVSGEEAVEVLAEQFGESRERQRKINRVVGCIVLLIISAIVGILGIWLLLSSLVNSL